MLAMPKSVSFTSSIVVEHDVLRLDIAVDDAALMSRAEAQRNIMGDLNGSLVGEDAVAS